MYGWRSAVSTVCFSPTLPPKGHQGVVIDIKHFVAARLPEVAVCHGSKATPQLSEVSQ